VDLLYSHRWCGITRHFLGSKDGIIQDVDEIQTGLKEEEKAKPDGCPGEKERF
jgi:hypothetical protein